MEEIDLGEPHGAVRQVVSGLVDHIAERDMLGARVVVVANMKPAKMRGVESAAMVLCGVGADGKTELVTPPDTVPAGTRVVFEAFPGEPDDVLNPRKKIFETIQPEFSINADGVATWRGCVFSTPEGPCRVTSLPAGLIK